jgi:hypothetical protein
MKESQLFSQIASLPEDLRKEVSDFVSLLQAKKKIERKVKERTFGYAKGFFTMAPDFNAPLEDFEEYM